MARKRAKLDGPGLTMMQERFVEEYLIDLDAKNAAIRAGYSKRSAMQIGHRTLHNPAVQEALTRRRKRLMQRIEVKPERVITELARIAFANITDVVEFSGNTVVIKSSDELTEDQAAALAEVSEFESEKSRNLKVKLHSKLDALDKLARHLGMYVDVQEHHVRHTLVLAPEKIKKPKEAGRGGTDRK